MRVLVDTSVWVDFLNGYPSAEAATLSRLIETDVDILTCGLVVTEVLQGIRRADSLPVLERHLLDMQWLQPREPETYLQAADVFRGLRKAGFTIRSTLDCIIASLAAEAGAWLLAKDRDMSRIIESGLLPLDAVPLRAPERLSSGPAAR